MNNAFFKEIIKRSVSLDSFILQDFLAQLDSDYLSHCSPEEIAEHIAIAQSLDSNNLAQILITAEAGKSYKIVIVAYDYFSEFSIICGLISSFGLNITGGSMQTLPKEKGRKKIVDLFYVQSIRNETFDKPQQELFKIELETLISLLEKEKFREARGRVNQRLISKINQVHDETEKPQSPLKGLLTPIKIQFDNRKSSQWTLLSIHGQDTPAFLYAFSNALAMRNIYIHKIKIQHQQNKIHDQLYIASRQGKKIVREADQQALQIAAVLIKQFIHFLAVAPDPVMAITHFDQFLDKILETAHSRPLISFLKQKDTMELLARLFGASNFLWEDFLRIRFDNLFPILEKFKSKKSIVTQTYMRRNLRKRLQFAKNFESTRKIVNDCKDEEMFRIDLRHLHEPLNRMSQFSEELSDLAELILSETLKICKNKMELKYGIPRLQGGKPCAFVVLGLGKLGGREIGYASDIELLFVYAENGQTDGKYPIENSVYFEGLTQEITGFVEARQAGIFQIDTRLRPYGDSGRWAIPFKQFTSYYSETGKSAQFERQALIKLRTIAGSRALGKKCEHARDLFVYSGDKWDKTEALELRNQQLDELVRKGKTNVKYSKGGLVDIEYLVQTLQIIHGKEDPNLRTPNTLKALAALSKSKVIPAATARSLKKNYLFLRSLIDALRMVRGNARDLLLPDQSSDEFIFLARRMGYAKKDWNTGGKELAKEVSHNMDEAQYFYQHLLK